MIDIKIKIKNKEIILKILIDKIFESPKYH